MVNVAITTQILTILIFRQKKDYRQLHQMLFPCCWGKDSYGRNISGLPNIYFGSAIRCDCFISDVILSHPQYDGNTAFFSNFFAGGLHAWGRLLVIPLEFQKTRHQPFPYNTAFLYGSVIVCGCFISTVRWKIQPFSPVFPLAGATAKVFFRLSLWNFNEKSTNRFL